MKSHLKDDREGWQREKNTMKRDPDRHSFSGRACGRRFRPRRRPLWGRSRFDDQQGDQYGWAVDYLTAEAARDAALRECGPGCRVALTFPRGGAYAVDQDADGTAKAPVQAALSECGSRAGSIPGAAP